MAWIYQDEHQVKKHGSDKAAHYVGWIDPEGKKRCKSCGRGADGLRNAQKLKARVEAELLTGTYQSNVKKTWAEFRKEYDEKIIQGMPNGSAVEYRHALNQFERIVIPKKMQGISNQTIAEFVAKRRVEPGSKEGSKVSPATVNKELRGIRAALRKAQRWGYVVKRFDFEFMKEYQKLPAVFAAPEHFGALYLACEYAQEPAGLSYAAADWWRGLLVLAYMSGWRIGQLLAFRRSDLDFDSGLALTRAEENKGKRDQRIPLHAVVLEHLRKLRSFEPVFFPWNHNRRKLYKEFARIQKAGGIKPAEGKAYYTFHDLRRGFASMNADRMTGDALQAHMQHKDYSTTQRYINLARQLRPAMENLYVPEIPKIGIA